MRGLEQWAVRAVGGPLEGEAFMLGICQADVAGLARCELEGPRKIFMRVL